MIAQIYRFLELLTTRGALLAIFKWSKFSLASYKIISRLKLAGVKPITVVDVGANVGQFAVAAAHLFDGVKVFPIEPDSRVAERLISNVGKDTAKNVRISAVGERVGIATFHMNKDSQVSSLLKLDVDRMESFPDSRVLNSVPVSLSTLDVMFDGVILSEPVLLKIDVQGYEDRVIFGAREFLKRVKWILIEVSFSKLYQGERDFNSIVALLRESNFVFVRPINFHISPVTGEIIEMDALFVADC